MLFLMRMTSIEKHIQFAIREVSFEILFAASTRIEYEAQYPHSLEEIDIIQEMINQVIRAKEAIKATLLYEYYNQ